jgi:hypothetical protein
MPPTIQKEFACKYGFTSSAPPALQLLVPSTMESTLAGGVGLDMMAFSVPAAFGSILMDGDEYVRCRHCGYGGCDLRIQCENGCTCHAVGFVRESAGRVS